MKATQKYHQKLLYELKNQNHLNVLGKQTIALKSSIDIFTIQELVTHTDDWEICVISDRVLHNPR